jgi:hypothetical protein
MYIRVILTVIAAAALVGIYFDGTAKREVRVVVGPRDTAARQGVVRRGVVEIDWQRKLLTGERLEVRGRWVGSKVKLVLMGTGAVQDSATVGGEFVLGTIPAQQGRAVYTLAAVAGGDTLEREDIPVEVEQGRQLRVLLLAASPDFENTFLSNWLSAHRDAVASRTSVSKDKYQLGFANMAERPLGELGPALLDGFDLVVADEGVLTPVVYRQVRERGLGLYIKVDSGKIWKPGMLTLERDSAGTVVVGMVAAGLGKIVYSAANTRYTEWMAGKRQDYAAYWSRVLRAVARTNDTAAEWSWRPALPRVGSPVEAIVETGAAMPSGLLGENVVYLVQDAALPFRWRGSYWPGEAGWFAARTPGGDTTWGYVWPADTWKGIYGDGKIAETSVKVEKAGLTRGWIYIVFLICIFILWIERKVL